MVDEVDCLWPLISFLANLFKLVRKIVVMALCSNSHHHIQRRKVPEPPELAASSLGVESVAEKKKDVCERRATLKTRKRPARIVVPEFFMSSTFEEAEKKKDLEQKDVEVEGSEYWLASRKGSRQEMEDAYSVMSDIHGDSKKAFFGVFDGHGGRAAVDFVSEKLGKNIIKALDELKGEEEEHQELAIREGHLTTDSEFLSQGMNSGACAATVLLKDGDLHVANVGDCRVVISTKGLAAALTTDHRPGREDERIRIESSGGYVNSRNGVWRVQDSLAVSRAFGDRNMKQWITSEPEVGKLRLTPDCEFLIIASDGLWDKVSNQEAVDVVSRSMKSVQCCRELVELSWRRGGRDDITVMVVDLQRFVNHGLEGEFS